MFAKVSAVYLGTTCNNFTDQKTGDVVEYRKSSFNVRGEAETFTLSLSKDMDVTYMLPYTEYVLEVDFRPQQNGTFKGRLVGFDQEA